jgi:hypothetical protein
MKLLSSKYFIVLMTPVRPVTGNDDLFCKDKNELPVIL